MKLNDKQFVGILIAPASVFVVLFLIYPVFLLLFQSFYKMSLLAPEAREFVGLANYQNVFTSSRIAAAAGRTVIYTVVTVGSEFLLGFAAALLFHYFGKRSQLARTVFLFPLMIPPIVAGLLWRFMLIDNFGIVNWILHWVGILDDPSRIMWLSNQKIALFSATLPDIWLTTCFITLILYTGLQNIPGALVEAAKIDGASAIQLFWHVTLPLLRPVIAVALIIRGLDAARTFDLVWILTEGGPRFASEILSLNIYQTMVRYGNIGQASATATVFMVGLLACSLVAFYSVWKPGQQR